MAGSLLPCAALVFNGDGAGGLRRQSSPSSGAQRSAPAPARPFDGERNGQRSPPLVFPSPAPRVFHLQFPSRKSERVERGRWPAPPHIPSPASALPCG
ncbi:hypothetical protein U9M48_031885 [Paspalum notatum var. saurae]|uniref:Uncharacterized protein n=1 Tax=Paspalum notatum var. saurae TaxID=547442 RepID=A0AAQ3U405_PASNO